MKIYNGNDNRECVRSPSRDISVTWIGVASIAQQKSLAKLYYTIGSFHLSIALSIYINEDINVSAFRYLSEVMPLVKLLLMHADVGFNLTLAANVSLV